MGEGGREGGRERGLQTPTASIFACNTTLLWGGGEIWASYTENYNMQ